MYTKYFSAVFLIVFTAAVGAWSLPALRDYSSLAPGGLINGEWATNLEKHYNERLPIRDIGIHFWTAVQYGLLHEGRSGVVVGRDGWLYTDEEFRVPADPDALSRRFREIDEINAYVDTRGVTLVLALIPAKARLYPQHLGMRRPDAFFESLYQRALHYAAEHGVLAPDLLSAMLRQGRGTRLFLKTDTHWTPEGAAVAAAAVAGAIMRHAVQPAGGEVHFETEIIGARRHRGDLLNFLPLGPFADWLGPAPDELNVYATRRADAAMTEAALFADGVADIALVGSSYSANSLWNFAGALRQALSREVTNFAVEGKGPLIPMLEYLASEDFARNPPRILIWEFPERYLPVSYSYPVGTELMAGNVNKKSAESGAALHGGLK